ncbi:hypothetical protein NC653_022309 [Populus alba x Populus x berolinensis]|uniref:AT1G08220-like protein n=1 Tax=Populus alba x Populus x berolinensis TaxID=444605 RepID=A0AAD6MF75_9ROSI|nr:hypothetical protein NC653_022309 [Populus alba x Populus x berolinensis]
MSGIGPRIGNKAAIEKERARLADELNRGYFADISEFKKHGGKIAVANKIIIPAVAAVKFPDVKVNYSNGTSLKLPIRSDGNVVGADATLMCLSFRASSQLENQVFSVVNRFTCMSVLHDIDTNKLSLVRIRSFLKPSIPIDRGNALLEEYFSYRPAIERDQFFQSCLVAQIMAISIEDGVVLDATWVSSLLCDMTQKCLPCLFGCDSDLELSLEMINSWSMPFLEAFRDAKNVHLYEVSFIDSWFLCLKPIKKMLLRMMRKSDTDGNDALQKQIVYSFGDHYYIRKDLRILNLLTGYIFLLDKFGRIRWGGFGLATEEELSSLVSCTSLLLEEK